MPDPVASGPAPRKRPFGPATLRQWAEGASLALLGGGAAALAYYRDGVTPWLQVAGWSVLALALAYLMRRGWVRLFGPVLFYDLVRNARRARTYLTRMAYLALLLLFLWSVVGSRAGRHHYPSAPMSTKEQAEQVAGETAALAESFFYTFLGVQFALAVLLTPAYVAPAIAEEKERKTLEFLLATDLDGREIVLDKLLARLGYLTLLLMTGVPVLSAVQFLGGVEPALVFAGFAATALTVAGLAGVSILCSVYARRSREAIVLTYVAVGLYVALCLLGELLIDKHYVTGDPFFLGGGPTGVDCVRAFQAGNPAYAISRVFSPAAGSVREAIPSVLPAYAAFYVVLTGVTVTLAVLRMRPVALSEAGGAKRGEKARRALPPVGDLPMVWKEKYCGGGLRLRWWGRLVVGLLVVLSFVPAFVTWVRHTSGIGSYYRSLDEEINNYVRTVGTLVACFGLFSATQRAAAAVRIEKDKDTLDSLLTSPLSTREILFGKWVGCLWGLRRLALWLGGIYLIGLVTGGLSPLAVPLLSGTMLVYCGSLATVGLWFSVTCRTTVRATVAALFAALGLGVGHWLLWLCCVPFGGGGRDLENVIKFQAGFTPPVVLAGILPFYPDQHLFGSDRSTEYELATFAVLGTICWAALGGLVWAAVNDRFLVVNNRGDVLTPEGRPPGDLVRPPPGVRPAEGWGPTDDDA